MTDFNGYLIGNSTINTPNIYPTSYNGLLFNGQGILDNICVRNYVQTDSEANNESISKTPDWTPDVLFRTAFNYTSDSSNVFSLVSPQTSWCISRQDIESNIIKTIAVLEPNINSFIDYKISGNKTFKYLISAQNDTQLSAPLLTDEIKTTFYSVYLLNATDIDNATNNKNVECYKFDMNCVVDKVSNTASITQYKNYTKYDSYFVNDTNYISGTVTGLLAYWENNEVKWDSNYLDKFRDFINNKQEKILKFKNGKVIRVTTFISDSESMNYQFDEGVTSTGCFQPTVITFGFKEVGEVE